LDASFAKDAASDVTVGEIYHCGLAIKVLDKDWIIVENLTKLNLQEGYIPVVVFCIQGLPHLISIGHSLMKCYLILCECRICLKGLYSHIKVIDNKLQLLDL